MDGLTVDEVMEVHRSPEAKAREVGWDEKGGQVTMEGHGRNMGGNNDSVREIVGQGFSEWAGQVDSG